MSILSTEELQQKVPTWTVAFVLVILIIGFGAGYAVSEIRAQAHLLEVKHNFALDEVQGLRNDMNREVQLLRLEMQEIKTGKEK